MKESYREYLARHDMEDRKMDAIERANKENDFWQSWAEKLKEKTDYGDDYIDEQIQRYKRHSQTIEDNPQNWPAGSADYKRQLVELVFKPLAKSSHGHSHEQTKPPQE